MKAIAFTSIHITGACPTTERYGAPYHYYPDDGEVYDVIGNYIGSATMKDGKLIVTRESEDIQTT